MKGSDPAPTKIQSNLTSPPIASSHDEDIGQSSSGHLDAGIYSDEQEGLIAPEEDEEEENDSIKQKLVAKLAEKKLGKNDHIIIKNNDVLIKATYEDDIDGDNLNDMNIII